MPQTILLTGATGYVGGRLLPRLTSMEHSVRCLVRDAGRLEGRPGAERAEIVEGDVLDFSTLTDAFHGVSTVYYLIHSMGSAGGFEDADRQAAEHVAKAACQAGVRRIVYLGGLGGDDADSPHLRSRHEVGRVLAASGVPTIELRASIVIGPGSLSFDLVRSLVERLPVMITPRWVRSMAQPIHIEDVLRYLEAGLTLEESHIVEIGGPERVSYSDLLLEYARQRGLRRWILHVPILSARLSSLWLGLVTPVYARIGRKLIDSLRHDTVVTSPTAKALFPTIIPIGVRESIATALRDEASDITATRWMDALSATTQVPSWHGVHWRRRRIDSRGCELAADPASVWSIVMRIGGSTGWYYGNWLWQLRGAIDLLLGGPGMRRGRRHLSRLLVGDIVDCWRVDCIEPGRLLRLEAQMRLPGRAWLQFELVPGLGGGTRLQQTAIFDPVGSLGLLYWWSVAPFHHLVFGGMLRGIAAASRTLQAAGGTLRRPGDVKGRL